MSRNNIEENPVSVRVNEDVLKPGVTRGLAEKLGTNGVTVQYGDPDVVDGEFKQVVIVEVPDLETKRRLIDLTNIAVNGGLTSVDGATKPTIDKGDVDQHEKVMVGGVEYKVVAIPQAQNLDAIRRAAGLPTDGQIRGVSKKRYGGARGLGLDSTQKPIRGEVKWQKPPRG